MEKIFDTIKTSSRAKIRILFDDDNEIEVSKNVKLLSHYDVLDIYEENYGYFVVSKTKIFDEIVYDFESSFKKWLENKKYNENLKLDEVKANIGAGKAAESSKWASWASALFALIAVVISYFQYKENSDITEKYNRAKQSIDSLSKIQAKIQLHTKGQEDSLKTLKRKP